MALSVESLVLEFGRALAPLERRLRAGEVALLFAELGLPAPDSVLRAEPVRRSIATAADALAALPDALSSLSEALESGDPAKIAGAGADALPLVRAAAAAVDAVAAEVGAAADAAGPGRAEVEVFAEELAERLFGFALVSYLERNRPVVGHLFRLLGVVEVTAHAATPAAPAHVTRVLRFDRLGALIDDPLAVLGQVYGWGTPGFDWDALLVRLSVFLGRVSNFAFVQLEPRPFLRVMAVDVLPTDDPVPGVQAVLRVESTQGLDLTLPVGDRATLTVEADAPLELGAALQLLPPADLRVVPPTSEVAGRLRVGVQAPPAPRDTPVVLLGAPGGSRVEARKLRASAGADLGWNDSEGRGEGTFALDAGLEGGRILLDLAGADGFLAALLPSGRIELETDLAVGWSSATGFHFDGDTGLRTRRGLQRQLGPLRLETVEVAVAAAADALTASVTVSATAPVGPVTATVESLGTEVTLRPGRGNLGMVDVRADFVPPAGVGLAVDAGVVTGGGFLAFDRARGLYAGEVQLQFERITVRAVGLLTTRLPDGRPGFSLLMIVSAEFPPVQLGLGFLLVDVGGLLGINRTVAVEPLRAGLKSGALGAVLSPPDPKASAGEIVASLAGVFPPAAGRHVFAPTARIVWGSPTLITIDLALVLELPAPVRLVALGRLRAVLPDEREAIVRLQVDALGVIDFGRSEAAVDATLVDSRLAQFALTGDMALRMSWGERPVFLLAVGGFHPRFAAPPGFPELQRVAVALASGDNPKLRLEAYLALTSNTVQFGARVDLGARAGSFSIAGFLSFDALVTLEPLAFEVEIAAKLAVKMGGRTVLSVSLALTLSGPRPWRAHGRASLSILFFDVSFRFDVTIGDETPTALPAPVDVAPLLLAALADARAWTAQLPAGAEVVTLRKLTPGTAVLAHPLGTLQLRQRLVPLERTLDRFGTSVPSGARRFRITLATIAGVRTAITPLQDRFAPGQFTALSDDAKLSAPSFEEMVSGAALGADGYATGPAVNVGVVYEQALVTATGVAEPKPQKLAMPADVFSTLTATVARRTGAFAVKDRA